jgi:hypothetical protein
MMAKTRRYTGGAAAWLLEAMIVSLCPEALNCPSKVETPLS